MNYYLDYSIGGLSVEQSSLDLRQTGVLTAAIDALADELNRQLALSDPDFNNALVLSHWKAQSYNGEQFVDLYDFCRLLQAHAKSDTVKGACGNVLKTEPDFVKNSCYSGPIYQYSYGVSIYFPWAELDPDYDTVRFGRDSKWVKFLENYVVATRREPRDPSGDAYGNNREAYAIRHTAGKHAPGKAMLPDILSMRNPPLSAGVSPCVENADGERQLLRGMTQSLSAE